MSTTLAPASTLVPSTRAPLSAAGLADVTRRYGRLLRTGAFGPVHYGDPARPLDPEARWHVRVHADDVVDVWLISWLPSQGTQLHDHGGSAGAFTVVRGELTEAVWEPGRDGAAGHLHDEARAAGSTTTFGTGHVHDVRNLGSEPAVSVHAYSHPLRRMGYYDTTGGSLQLTAVLDTTDPEPTA